MRFDVLTLFPDLFSSYLRQSLLKAAIDKGLVEVCLWNIRDWAEGKHQSVDDPPYGGGPGMLMMCPPVVGCVEHVKGCSDSPGKLIMLTPQGEKLDQKMICNLATYPRILFLCGRYEGFDERIREELRPEEVSVGDFVCNGGEVPAMLMIDALVRMVPGVLGDADSQRFDSFRDGMLEYPQYTRPREFRGLKVPDVLLGGNHAAIESWRQEQSLLRTRERRPDLL